MIVNAVIEIPKNCKYKYRYENGIFRKVRKLEELSRENYGFIENTIAPDNSPMDIIVLTRNTLKQGPVKVKVIGALTRTDKDDKAIAVPLYSRLKSLKDVPLKRLKIIVNAWTGHPGQAPFKKFIDSKEALKLINKYKI